VGEGPDEDELERLGVYDPEGARRGLVSQTVRDSVHEAFIFPPLDPLVLKGFAEPVAVYGVQRAPTTSR
jgi:class 3 adenylate cyclase